MAEAECKSTELNGKEEVLERKWPAAIIVFCCHAPQRSPGLVVGGGDVYVCHQVAPKRKNLQRISTTEEMLLEAKTDAHSLLLTMVTLPLRPPHLHSGESYWLIVTV